MKIKRIVLKDFHQFKDVDIDLTYPLGHPKAGQPLDKVCIIGQSGTGKTTLLKIIGGHTFTLESALSETNSKDFQGVSVFKSFDNYDVKVKIGIEDNQGRYFWSSQSKNNVGVTFEEASDYEDTFLEKLKTHFIYFPADLRYDGESSDSSLSDKKVIDFTKEKVANIWKSVFDVIQKFQEEEIKLKQAIAKAAVESNADVKVIQKAVSRLEKWKKTAENPIKKLAEECLDPILKHIHLQVKQEFSFESKGDIGILKLEDLGGNEVPYNLLSTGTKQIMLTALPLYLLKPDGALILSDEPERSLYPSLQKIIIDYYISLTQNSQFFFATHSPIIASCFDPWEIVELKFDKNGHVFQEKYYPKNAERHVDNYTIVPAYLTYDLILSKVFDVDETQSTARSEKITEALMLRNQLLTLKEKGKSNSAESKKIYEKYKDIANKLFWDFSI